MPNIASVLKAEIVRLARKQLRCEVESMRLALVAAGAVSAALMGWVCGMTGVGFILWFALPEATAAEVIGCSLLLAAGGFGGDLLASGIKRRHGVKDFGRSLGRMGGVLDRLDSLLGAGWVYLACVVSLLL